MLSFSHTLCNPRKSKSGDASYIGELLINQQHYTIAIVCDGVSSAPKDWLASASIVEVILAHLQENKNKQSLPQLLKDAIVDAHTSLFHGYKNTDGMLSVNLNIVWMPIRKTCIGQTSAILVFMVTKKILGYN
ncbi:MAG: hypothetical protein IPN09_02120 [Bacteroidetes bacterium]|nr:hypothetical protein [Bacteroidota bacterium]